MNDRQQAHVSYFLERVEYWKGLRRDETTARMLAARDADHRHPLLTEQEGREVFEHLRLVERERTAAGSDAEEGAACSDGGSKRARGRRLMAKRRAALPVTLSEDQRERLKSLESVVRLRQLRAEDHPRQPPVHPGDARARHRPAAAAHKPHAEA
jgi:hypothetical protein